MRKIILLALAVSGTLSLLSLAGRPSLYADQALQLTCVEAWRQGETPFPNWVLAADPDDLARDRLHWEVWHAPGFPLLMTGLLAFGLTPGAALQMLAIFCFIAGCTGWSLWALRFPLPRPVHLALPCLIPGIRYGNDNLVHFQAEAFLFAATPWLLLAALRLSRADHGKSHLLRASVLGGALGLLFVLKYSGLFVAVGIVAILLAARAFRSAPVVALVAAIPVLLLSAINHALTGTENLVTASWQIHFHPATLLYLAGTIPLTLADAGQIFEAAFLHPAYGVFHHPWIVPCLGLPGLVFLFVVLYRRPRPWRRTQVAAFVFVLTHLALMAVVWSVCGGVGYDRRYLATASLALMPLALSVTLRYFRATAGWRRCAAILFLGFYLLLPVLYGYVTFAVKAIAAARYQPTVTQLGDPLLADRDGKQVAAFLARQFSEPARDLWYFPEPILALDLPGRRIFGKSSWDRLDEPPCHTSRFLRVFALASGRFPPAAARAYLTRLFPQARAWKTETVPQANYVLWIGELRP